MNYAFVPSLAEFLRIQLRVVCLVALLSSAKAQERTDSPAASADEPCRVLADRRVKEPLGAIVEEYGRLSGNRVEVTLLPAAEVGARIEKRAATCDVVLCMAPDPDGKTPVESLPGAKTVAWKYPEGWPVFAAALTEHPQAKTLIAFSGGPTGHRLWSESQAGFTIVAGEHRAEAHEWVVQNRVKHTYPLSAARMMAELGGIRQGTCIDVGCGTGMLELELAKRSEFRIIGLDIDPDAKPLFEKRIREAGLERRVSFVLGDAQKMPFPDNCADVIVSRGTLIFIPDIKKCLQEVSRVLKPTGVAFLGGRYVYTPQVHKIATEKLETLVRESGVAGARVIDARGQWVKIVGSEAPEAAHQFQGGPHMLANRFVADYAITEGRCLLICGSDGDLQQALQRGFAGVTELQMVALYSSEEIAAAAEKRIAEAKLADRIACKVGSIRELPFDEGSFDLVAGVGPMLIFEKDKENAMREVHRVLRPGGAALIGGRYLGMPDWRKVPSQVLREAAARTGIPAIRVYDDMGQWVEIRKASRSLPRRD